ncbi:MAG: hypothetical protein J3R72DRAFT_449114 [Linnemannia gamsii]|nr:MAG: hypothetical protein J3R72DRAFT_449114 [Linnemannia gamsii]
MTLTIQVGPSRHQASLKPCLVNIDSEPVFISSDHFEGFVTVRIQQHNPPSSSSSSSQSAPTCAYFDNRSRVFSLQWQGRFKATNPSSKDKLWNADEVLFVAEVENKIHVPMGTSIATAFARTIDPSFIAEGIWETRRPWVGSPLVSGMNVLRVWRALSSPPFSNDDAAATPAIGEDGSAGSRTVAAAGEEGVGPWIYHGTTRLEEGNVDLLLEAGAMRQQQQGQTTSATIVTSSSMDSITTTRTETGDQAKSTKLQGLTSYQRRRYFTRTEHRQSAVLAPDLVVAGDFFNNFTNFETRRVKMGVSIRMDRVLEEQPLRFVCKSRQPSIKLRNRNRRNKHEAAGSTLSGGAREEGGEMDNAVEEQYDDADNVDSGNTGGERDELQQGEDEEMEQDDEDRAIVFFVVELRWDAPSSVVL